ncbi:E3 ubiquitin-protein ligase RNF128 [Hondaea fermentalgiana]|uniref:E3 ubiquitin-protein ligase RNF128 n=1 Tax=Hondaea fermentalgiana TaxID=2315210 RepID=A0A2R5GE06_9STRA|nr:E3 ubiquitin-protein ligase RNF128 [Hondaea fermentalgiana]|eukprot:GBG27958.1 E3 ubiquitin-protein ligase RNF128 [Hondaea fermentalgiana]
MPAQRCHPCRGHLSRCFWLMVMVVTVLALFLLYTEFSLLSAEFWQQLATRGSPPGYLFQPATAYCGTQDIMLLFGGRLISGLATDSLYIYEFSSGTFHDVTSDAGGVMQARWGSVAVSIDPHVDREGTCRFLVHGGVTDTQVRYDRASDARVWAIEVENDLSVVVSEIDTSDGDEVFGRYKSSATGFNDRMILYGGASGMNDEAIASKGLWCLTLDEYNTTAEDQIKGSWTTLSSQGLSERFSQGSVLMGDELWALHGGYSQPGAAYMQGTLMYLNLSALVLEADGNATASEQPHRVVEITQSSELTRANHIVGTAASSRVLMYGGVRSISSDSSAVTNVDYVAVTNIVEDSSVEDSDDDSGIETDFVVRCNNGRFSYTWCGFIAQNPGVAASAIGVQRGISKMVVVMAGVSGVSVFQMDSALVMSRGGFVNAVEYENSNSLFAGFATLKYALIAAAIFVLVSLFVLFRYRGNQLQVMIHEERKTTGVSQEVVDGLPLVRYKSDGKHVYVKRAVDASGVEVTEDLPAEEQVYLHPRAQRDETHSASISSDNEALMDAQDTSSSHESSATKTSVANEADIQKASEVSVSVAQALPVTGDTAPPAFDPATFYAPDDEGDLCAICILPFEDDEILRELPCKHFYHEECIDPWLLRKGNCPLCKCHVVTGHPVESDEGGDSTEGSSADGDTASPANVEVQVPAAAATPRESLHIGQQATSAEERERQASRAFLGTPILHTIEFFRARRAARAARAARATSLAATVPQTQQNSDASL